MNYDLKNNGWVVVDSCVCGGQEKHTYTNTKYRNVKIIIVSKTSYYVLLANRQIAFGKTTDLEIKLKELNYV